MNAKASVVAYRELKDALSEPTVKAELTASLSRDIDFPRFVRAACWSAQTNPQLQQCSIKSLITACQRAALDGLLPDGREGAIVAYRSDSGDGRQVLTAQWIPMIYGIRKKILASGKVKQWDCQVVQQGDQFEYE